MSCEELECSNEGVCLEGPDGGYCRCPRGYRGRTCETQGDVEILSFYMWAIATSQTFLSQFSKNYEAFTS